jgi:hypothetical protein
MLSGGCDIAWPVSAAAATCAAAPEATVELLLFE